jgi:hypothetical protein
MKAPNPLRYSSALLPKRFERPGPKSVSPATYCSGVEVVVWCRWIVDSVLLSSGSVQAVLQPGLSGYAIEVKAFVRLVPRTVIVELSIRGLDEALRP